MRDLIDKTGENRAVRMFLALYGGMTGISVKQMKIHLEHSGFNDCWPAWVIDPANQGHLTKGGAQDWLRHLFALEQGEQPADERKDAASKAAVPYQVGDRFILITPELAAELDQVRALAEKGERK